MSRRSRASGRRQGSESRIVAEQQARRRRNVVAMESWRTEGYPEVVDPRDFWPEMYRGGLGGMSLVGRSTDRAQGEQPPTIETQQDLDLMLGMGRYLADINAVGMGLVNALTNYTIGDGWVVNVDRHPRARPSEQLVDACNRIVEDALEANDWTDGGLERECFRRTVRDGELLLACYPAEEMTRLRTVEPEQVREGTDLTDEDVARFGIHPEYATNWKLGVHKYDHDARTVLGYRVEWTDTVDYLPASLVVHAKRNTDSNTARGVSDFWPVWRWMTTQDRLLRRVLNGASLQASIAWMVQHATGVTETQVSDMRRENADYSRTNRNGLTGASQTVDIQEMGEGGRIIDHGAGTSVEPGPSGQMQNPFLDVSGAILRYVGVRWNAPEYLVSGDASNSNYASSVEAGAPWYKTIESNQSEYRRVVRQVVNHILANAADAGFFKQYGVEDWETLRRLVRPSIKPCQIENRDPLQQTQRRSQLKADGVISLRTYREEENYDPDEEETKVKAEAAEQPQQPPGGPQPPPGGPGGNQPPQQPQPQPAAPRAMQQPVARPVESVAAEAFDPSQPRHPKGSSEGGRFASKGFAPGDANYSTRYSWEPPHDVPELRRFDHETEEQHAERARLFDSEKRLDSKVRDSLHESDLSDEQKAANLARFRRVTQWMPAGAIENLAIRGIGWYANTEELTKVAFPSSKHRVGGAYDSAYAFLSLDGDWGGGGPEWEGAYAHELGHAADRVPVSYRRGDLESVRISDQPEWKEAFDAEIAGGRLSQYATTSTSEGFAEFARLMWGGFRNSYGRPSDVHDEFPKCSEVFVKYGLAHPRRTKRT